MRSSKKLRFDGLTFNHMVDHICNDVSDERFCICGHPDSHRENPYVSIERYLPSVKTEWRWTLTLDATYQVVKQVAAKFVDGRHPHCSLDAVTFRFKTKKAMQEFVSKLKYKKIWIDWEKEYGNTVYSVNERPEGKVRVYDIDAALALENYSYLHHPIIFNDTYGIGEPYMEWVKGGRKGKEPPKLVVDESKINVECASH